MKIAVVSESPADEAALHRLLEAVRDEPVELVRKPASFETRGWGSVRNTLPAVLLHLYYHTDADGLVVLADSDDSPLHAGSHERTGGYEPTCRLCVLRVIGERTLATLRGKVVGRELRFAVALAVPAVENWWRCGLDPHATEQAWARNLPNGPYPYARKDLKRAVYGTDRPSLPLETAKMVEAAGRLAGDLTRLERSFPIGFGRMATAVRGW